MILRSKMLHPPIGGDFWRQRQGVAAAAAGVFSILQSRKKTAKMAAGGSNKISTPQTNWPFFPYFFLSLNNLLY
jgi:hypothetical protein